MIIFFFIIILIFIVIRKWLVIRQIPEKADAIHVLGGDGPNFRRTNKAISLFYQGLADTIVFTGFGEDLQAYIKKAEDLGLPESKRIVIEGCLHTIDEALAIKKLNKSWKKIIIITDILQTRRALRTFQKILPNIKIYSCPALNLRYNKKIWWKTGLGIKSVFSELVKLAYYYIKYRINPL